MLQPNSQDAARLVHATQRLSAMIVGQRISAEGYSNVALNSNFRDAPQYIIAVAALYPDTPSYRAFILREGVDPVATALKLREDISTFQVRDEARRRLQQVRGEFLTGDASPGTFGNEVSWAMESVRAVQRELPIAFIMYNKYADDGGDAMTLHFPISLAPEDVLAHFKDAIGAR